eukprot:scaffold20310_cov125-Isochrysis_galbana.AAC.12
MGSGARTQRAAAASDRARNAAVALVTVPPLLQILQCRLARSGLVARVVRGCAAWRGRVTRRLLRSRLGALPLLDLIFASVSLRRHAVTSQSTALPATMATRTMKLFTLRFISHVHRKQKI